MSGYGRSNETLEAISRSILSKYAPALLHDPAPIPVEAIMEKVFGLTIEFHYIRKNGRILGETIFEDSLIPIYERKNQEGYKLVPVKAGTVIIDASLVNSRSDGRFRYTCAHELSHWVIDKEYFTQIGEPAAMTRKNTRSSETDIAIERQADRLACRLLMPKGTTKMAFYRYRTERNVIAVLAEFFGVSCQAMEIRLTEMGLLF